MHHRATVVGCVSVSGLISPCSNESPKKTIRSLQHCKNIQVKREGIRKTATEFMSKLLAICHSFCLPSLAHVA